MFCGLKQSHFHMASYFKYNCFKGIVQHNLVPYISIYSESALALFMVIADL